MKPLPAPVSRAASATAGGKIYVLGGISDSGPTTSVTMYDPAQDSWQEQTALSEPRYDGGEAAFDSTIYIAGGAGATGADTTVVAYDTANGASSTIGNLAAARTKPSAAVINNKLYVIGGSSSGFDSIEEFDLTSRTSTIKTWLPGLRQHASAVAIGSRIYIIGGLDGSGNAVNTCWVYDTVTNMLVAKSPLPIAATGKGAYALDGQIYVVGGLVNASSTPSWNSTVFRYDPVDDKWQEIGALLTSRYAAATAITGGSIYVVGGENGQQSSNILNINEAAVLNPSGKVWDWQPIGGVEDVTAVAAGGEQYLGLKKDGTIWTWGGNIFGELGRTGGSNPAPVPDLAGFSAVAGGDGFSLALKADGAVWTWGYYSTTPVEVPAVFPAKAIAAWYMTAAVVRGDGTVWQWTFQNRQPLQVQGIANVATIALGSNFTVAAKADGAVWTWGDNTYGQLGRSGEPAIPAPVPDVNGIIAVAAGDYYGAALKSDGTVWNWGNSVPPAQVGGLADVVAISGGRDFLLALKKDGTVWTLRGFGASAVTEQVKEVSGVTAIAAYSTAHLAVVPTTPFPRIVVDKLAVGTTGSSYFQPLNVAGGTAPYTWSVSGALPAGLTLDSTTGIISGTPTTAEVTSFTARVTDYSGARSEKAFSIAVYQPLTITTAATLPQVFAGMDYNTVLTAAGGNPPYLWSIDSGMPPGLSLNSRTGELTGRPTSAGTYTLSVRVNDSVSAYANKTITLTVNPAATITTSSLVAGVRYLPYSQTIAAANGAPPYTWSVSGSLPPGLTLNGTTGTISGSPTRTGTFTFTINLGDGTPLVCSKTFSITIHERYAVWTWGSNGSGQLGRTGLETQPAAIPGLDGVKEVSGGYLFSTALKADGTLVSWGLNNKGQLGDGTYTNRISPVPVINLNSVNAIASGYGFTLALRDNGSAWSWGDSTSNLLNRTGAGNIPGQAFSGSIKAVAADGLGAVLTTDNNLLVQINDYNGLRYNFAMGNVSAMTGNRIALKPDGTVWNAFGAQVPVLMGITAISSGDSHHVALKGDGTVWTWGSNSIGQLGRSGDPAVPGQVAGLSGVMAVSAQGNQTVVLKSDGTVWNWGNNQSGILGRTGDSTVPGQVPGLSDVAAISAGWTHTIALVPISYKPTIDNATLPDGKAGMLYQQSLTAKGGTPPYTWSVAAGSRLPRGLRLETATGIISGYPVAAGTDTFTIQVTEVNGNVGTKTFTLKTELVPGEVWSWWADTATRVDGLEGVVAIAEGDEHRVALKYDGTVWTWGSNGGNQLGHPYYYWDESPLPMAGIGNAVAISAGAIHTTVLTADGTIIEHGNYWNNPRQFDNTGFTAISGGDYYTIALKNDGTVWTWLYDQSPRQLTGFPKIVAIAAGRSYLGGIEDTALAEDGTLWAWTFNSPTPHKLDFVTDVIAMSQRGQYILKTDGSVYNTTFTGAIAVGETGAVKSDGTVWYSLYSTPTKATGLAGVTAITSTTALVPYTVPTLLPSTVPFAVTGTPYTQKINVVGGKAPYSCSVSAGTLPAGLSLDGTTCTILGTPTTAMAASFTITGTASGISGTRTYSVDVFEPLLITTQSIPPAGSGIPYLATISGSGGKPPYSWAYSGLPTGLNFDSSTGVISGTTTAGGSYSPSFSVRDANGSTYARSFPLSVLQITTTSLPQGQKGAPYSASLTANDSSPGLRWSISTGILPAGLLLDPVSGLIVGTPAVDGTFTFTAELRLDGTLVSSKTLTINVTAQATMGAAWVQVGPTGGNISFFAVDPAIPSTVYAASSTGGVFKSLDYGNSWRRAGLTLADAAIRSLIIDPSATSTLYAATANSIYKSIDGGENWGKINTGLNTYASINSLTIDTTAPSTIYAATSDGVFKSFNGGASWKLAAAAYQVRSVIVDPVYPHILYSLQSGNGIYKSVDSGTTWMAVNNGLPEDYDMGGYLVSGVTAIPGVSGRLYATGNGSLYLTTDAGVSWSLVNTGIANIQTVFPQAGERLYGIIGGTLYQSINNGTSWTPLNSGLSTSVQALGVDPVNGARLYAACGNEAGIYRSSDSGTNWAPANTGLINASIRSLASTSTSVLAGTYSGNLFSGDGRANWTPMGTGLPAGYTINAIAREASNGYLYAATGSGIFKYTGSGSWFPANSGINQGVNALVMDSSTTPETLYAATYGGVYRSADGAGSWTADNGGFPGYYFAANALALAPTSPAKLYSAISFEDGMDYQGGVFTRSGTSAWTRIDPTNSYLYASAIAANPAGDVVFAGTASGVYKSVNGGAWTAVNNGLSNLDVKALVADPAVATTIYAATTAGVFMSVDNGASWGAINNGLFNLDVRSLMLDLTTGALYAGTNGGSVYRLPVHLAIVNAGVPAGTAGVAYSTKMEAEGGTPGYNWAVTAGSLPAGVTLDGATGLISGTPTTPGSYNFTITVSDTAAASASRSFTLAVPGIATSSLADGTVTVPYSHALSADGGTAPYTWAVTGGALPGGLSLDPATGHISGTPTQAGSFAFTITATDANGITSSRDFTLTIYPELTIGTVSLAGGTISINYSQTMAAAGGLPPYSWSVSSGKLPAGLSIDPETGTIAGVPGEDGSFPVILTVSDSNGASTAKSYTLVIASSLVITTEQLVDGNVGIVFSSGLSASGGTEPYTWRIVTGALPAGLALEPSSGIITGTPAASGSFTFTVSVTDGNGVNVEKALSLTITFLPVSDDDTIPNFFATLQAAYDAITDGHIIRAKAQDFSGDVVFNRDIAVTVQGGYAVDYSSIAGYTTVKGAVVISAGSVTLDNIVVGP